MKTVQRIAKNTRVLFAAYGKYSFALVFTSMFGALTSLGIDQLIIREVARDKSKASKYYNC